MEQIDIKSSARSRRGVKFDFWRKKRKMEKMLVLGPPGSVCKQRFFGVAVGVLGVK